MFIKRFQKQNLINFIELNVDIDLIDLIFD